MPDIVKNCWLHQIYLCICFDHAKLLITCEAHLHTLWNLGYFTPLPPNPLLYLIKKILNWLHVGSFKFSVQLSVYSGNIPGANALQFKPFGS